MYRQEKPKDSNTQGTATVTNEANWLIRDSY